MRSQMRCTMGLVALGLAVVIGVGEVGCRSDYAGTSDGGSSSVGKTLSFFTAFQVDPRSEDSAGPQFVVAEDLNNDGLMDLVTAWNQSQPVQIHLQHRTGTGAIRPSPWRGSPSRTSIRTNDRISLF